MRNASCRTYSRHRRMTGKSPYDYSVGCIKKNLQLAGDQHGNGKEDDR